MKEFLELSHITKVYNAGKESEIRALEDFSLTVARGEFVTLLGPSGCGKSTALRVIAGLEAPEKGEIYRNGKDIRDVSAHQREMPMVFQNYGLFPHMTVYENIAYGLKARKKSREIIRNDVAMACQVVNLAGLEKRYPQELSGGQQQRVALARSLVLKPEMILFDEPLSNLDIKLRLQARAEIKRVQRMLGITVLYVTHDQSEAMSMSDRIVVMNHGKIIQAGTPEEIYHNPENAFVADFLGNSNFISASIEEIEGKRMTLRLQNKLLVVKKKEKEEAFEEGEEIYLSIKPEAVSLSNQPTDFSGVVNDRAFLGSYTEYRIEFEGSFINIHVSDQGEIHPLHALGDRVNLKFNKDLFHIYRK